MKGIIPLIILIASHLAFAVEMEEGKDRLLFKCRDYQLCFFKTKGTFEFLVKDREGNLHPIHNPQGESPWFGYNSSRGEVRSSQNVPTRLEVKKQGEWFRISLVVPLGEEALYEGEFFVADDLVTIRSLIMGGKEGKISIVRVAPRFEVDIKVFPRFAFSIPGGTISGVAEELGRPGYAGVGGWGGPKSYGSFDPVSPFFALYNPDLEVGFLILYPFYERLWKGKHIFLQLWNDEINYLYAGWGDEKDLGKEFLFAIAPLKVSSPQGIAGKAEQLDREIEEEVKKGELPFPSLLKVLEMERKIERSWEICQNFIERRIPQLENSSLSQLREWEERLFEVQRLFLSSKIALERGDYEASLLYAEEMLKTLGIAEGRSENSKGAEVDREL